MDRWQDETRPDWSQHIIKHSAFQKHIYHHPLCIGLKLRLSWIGLYKMVFFPLHHAVLDVHWLQTSCYFSCFAWAQFIFTDFPKFTLILLHCANIYMILCDLAVIAIFISTYSSGGAAVWLHCIQRSAKTVKPVTGEVKTSIISLHAVFRLETLGPGIHVNVTVTCSAPTQTQLQTNPPHAMVIACLAKILTAAVRRVN